MTSRSVVIVLIVCFSSHVTWSAPATETGNGGFQCPGNTTGYYADPNDCHYYYACVGSVSYHMQCAANLFWDQASQNCVYPSESSCQPGPGPASTTPAPITLGSGVTTTLSSSDPCHSNPCAVGSTCHSYHQQVGANSGSTKFVCICPPGYTGFYCRRFQCPPINSQNQGGLYPASDDCTHYYQCTGRVATLRSCPANLVFNPVLHVCDWPYNSGCVESNNCYDGACANGGTCVDGPNSYTCDCAYGYEGSSCSTFDPCSSNPCFYGDCYATSETAYRCACYPDYTGSTCKIAIDHCTSQPCQNGGTCTQNGYMYAASHDDTSRYYYYCTCPYGWTGTNCQAIDKCAEGPCVYGQCYYPNMNNITSDNYICSCYSGATGPTCESIIDSCQSNPCQHGGQCTSSPLTGRYYCDCVAPYAGYSCERANACASQPCIPIHETCTNTNGGMDYTCTCNDVTCLVGFDGCESNPCQHDGQCIRNSLITGPYHCDCVAPYVGYNCERADACASHPCIHGTCANTNNGTDYTCTCYSGVTGSNCETATVDYCSNSPCMNGGTCKNNYLTSDYECTCVPGFTGDDCQTFDACSSNPCNGGCTNVGSSYLCFCSLGFTGHNCETEIEPCISNPCKRGGTCVSYRPIDYYCRCPDGYRGLNCEELDACGYNHCHWPNGDCTNIRNGTAYTCTCRYGATGRYCENTIDRCKSQPCLNGGSCTEYQYRGQYNNPPTAPHYTCLCPTNYTGVNCQHTNLCSSNPCHNGSCRMYDSDDEYYYRCNCYAGYTGEHCETDACASIECQNGGTCVHGNSFRHNYNRCNCPPGFTGSYCETIDYCANNSCVYGTCYNYNKPRPDRTYHCSCNYRVTGENCDILTVDYCESNPCQNGGTCHMDPYKNSYYCDCPSSYYGTNCQFPNACTSTSAPCHGHGICYNINNGTSTGCTCDNGYSGPHCGKTVTN